MAQRTLRGEVESAFQDMAKGVGNAVDSIREALIDKGWFGQGVSPQGKTEWGRTDLEPEPAAEPNIHGYVEDPRADWDNVRDAAQKFYGNDREQGEWDNRKEQAERLYGHEASYEPEREQEIDR